MYESITVNASSVCTECLLVSSSMLAMFCVAFLLSSASFLISSATTAKPFPASPALAASIAALSARRLVCSVMLFMDSTILPTFSVFSDSFLITVLVCSEAFPVSWAMLTMFSTDCSPSLAAWVTVSELVESDCDALETFCALDATSSTDADSSDIAADELWAFPAMLSDCDASSSLVAPVSSDIAARLEADEFRSLA